jgi:type II secretory pathway component PulF
MPQTGRRNVDHNLLTALACGATVEAAARSAGVSESTVYRRLRQPAFSQRLQEVRADMVQRTSAMLTASGMEAVKTLLALQQASTPASVRLGAARAILEIGLKVREVADLERRLSALEQQLSSANPG